MESADVVVLGAGSAGLAAAWRAARRGFSVTVLDRADCVGGLSASFEVAGVRVDYGSRRLPATASRRVLGDLAELLGSELQTRNRHGRLRIAGRWVSSPPRPAALARSGAPRTAARVARDRATSRLRRDKGDTYESQQRATVGPAVYDSVYGPLAQKVWGVPGSQLAAERTRRGLRGRQPFHYPRRGFGQICERLAEAASLAGADIRLGTEVDGLTPTYEDVLVRTRDGLEVDAGIVLSTLPLPLLGRLTSPGPSLQAVESAARVRFRALVLVYLVHTPTRWSEYDAHYLPDPDTPVSRISEPTNYRDSADDPRGHTVLCAELPCSVGDSVWTATDDDLAAVVEDTLDRHDLPPVRRGGLVVQRLRAVHPVYTVGYRERLRGIDSWVSGVPQLVTFGRLGLSAHDNSHQAMAQAYEAVDALGLDGHFDVARWRARRRLFAGTILED